MIPMARMTDREIAHTYALLLLMEPYTAPCTCTRSGQARCAAVIPNGYCGAGLTHAQAADPFADMTPVEIHAWDSAALARDFAAERAERVSS